MCPHPAPHFWAAARVHLSSVGPAQQQRSLQLGRVAESCTHAEREGCREGSWSKYRALIEMPSVTTLAFNYLTCWQLEAGKQAGEKEEKASEEQKAELDSDLM